MSDHDILHILDSSSAAGSLWHSGVPYCKNSIAWWDCLLHGPVPNVSSLEDLTKIRIRSHRAKGQFPHDALRPAPEGYRNPSLIRRDRRLRTCSQYKEVVLWFGQTPNEQISLLQVLDAIAAMDLEGNLVTMISPPELGMGSYSPANISTFFPSRSKVSRHQISVSRNAWQLYRSEDPRRLLRFAHRISPIWPALSRALLFQFQEYPSVHNGLSRSQETLLTQLAASEPIVRACSHVIGTGPPGSAGTEFLFADLWRFLHSKVPLAEPLDASLLALDSWQSFCRLRTRLTAAGDSVLQGNEIGKKLFRRIDEVRPRAILKPPHDE